MLVDILSAAARSYKRVLRQLIFYEVFLSGQVLHDSLLQLLLEHGDFFDIEDPLRVRSKPRVIDDNVREES